MTLELSSRAVERQTCNLGKVSQTGNPVRFLEFSALRVIVISWQ